MIFSGTAQLVAGDEHSLPELYALLEKSGVHIHANSDVYVRVYGMFGVDDARSLRERASLSSLSGAGRIFITVVDSMTNEAQNALLKVYEEPPADAAFFLIIPSPESLLPTLLSRMQRLKLSLVEDDERAREFLRAPQSARLEMVGELLEKDEKDKRDVGAILSFLASLERLYASHPQGLEAVYRARKYTSDKGALLKPLLEQVALLAPVIK